MIEDETAVGMMDDPRVNEGVDGREAQVVLHGVALINKSESSLEFQVLKHVEEEPFSYAFMDLLYGGA